MEQFKNKKTELEACFTANKCTVPQPKSHAAAAADPDAMKKMKCGVAMMKKGMDTVVDCVKKEFPDFKMPHFNFSGMHQFHPEQLCAVLNESCGTDGNRTGVTRCLFKTFMDNATITALKKDHNEFCSEANHCVAKMNRNCENEFFKVKEVGEKCAENLMKNPGNFTQGITECDGVDLKSQAQGQCSFGSHGPPKGGKSGKGTEKPEKKNPKNICGSFDDHRDAHFSYGHNSAESGH